MIRITLVGANGRMGHAVAAACGAEHKIVARVDSVISDGVYNDISFVLEKSDIIVDFSSHTYTENVLEYAKKNSLPVVIATTGHTPEELEMIKEASAVIPVFKSGNMSIAVNVLCRLAAEAAGILEGFDIEIIETHHRNKLDAPSGTALMIASAIEERTGEMDHVTDRTDRSEKRPDREIGIHSVRGGTDIGEHEVIFFGRGERMSIKHIAEGRELFAQGALRACSYLVNKPAGYYDMRSLLLECGKESK
ncbi:MAG: 4-hydroxy-tetrahydrodipicolinate reductase [Clostridia bacterium]|nr:4-hydroxy-tetrahydrodipicolinate reductase [Clostridia bacterium]